MLNHYWIRFASQAYVAVPVNAADGYWLTRDTMLKPYAGTVIAIECNR